MTLHGQGDAGEHTEREYAAMSEKLGQKLHAGLSGGKAQLLKVLKVSKVPASPLFPSRPQLRGERQNEQRTAAAPAKQHEAERKGGAF